MSRNGGSRWTQETLACIEKCLCCCICCGGPYQGSADQGEARRGLLRALPLLECAEICRATAYFLRRDSEFWKAACTLCADVCEKCARECEQLSGDEQIRACAQSCAQCAAACRQLVKMGKTSVSHHAGESESCLAIPPAGNQPAGWSEAELH
jgi:hypothetical protein